LSAHDEYCLAQLRQGDRDRYLTLLFAPASTRNALAAIAAFNLELARAASEITESMLGLVRLQWWREAVEEIRAGGALRRHQVAEALAAATRAHGLSTDWMLAMIASREEELESEGPPTQAVFDARADATAANVIRLSLRTLALDPEETVLSSASASVGRAYATVGCARSVLRPQPALQACLRLMAMRAERDLQAARQGSIPRRARPLLLTGRLAALHLERLRRAAYDPFDPRVIASAPFDVWRLLGTTITGRF
jgi:NADH dehydrogenase [ubiquinone] 1 alpha subcomplex assembly factor 6